MSETLRCRLCKGTGRDPNGDGRVGATSNDGYCPECNGEGSVTPIAAGQVVGLDRQGRLVPIPPPPPTDPTAISRPCLSLPSTVRVPLDVARRLHQRIAGLLLLAEADGENTVTLDLGELW